jgi:transcriptional regulator with XRE-family HTH domain/KaiC/GvpD/RAD55 family RecA-like ATPase
MNHLASIESGVGQLDRLLDGLYIGDNVVWHDDAGSLAMVFCLNFLKSSEQSGRPLIYLSFDRSPTNLLDKLGALADSPQLTVIDCFTWGKGAAAEVFTKFYEKPHGLKCRIIPVQDPRSADQVTDVFYRVHGEFEGDVRFIFESITGMQELWGGEEAISSFYSHTCPRLYELNTVAYWILEKEAHSTRLRAQITQVAQVVIDLAIKRGTTSLTILKAEKRELDSLHTAHTYWTKGLSVIFAGEPGAGNRLNLGATLKELRTQKGLSQAELARQVGVTPSTISQVETNQIYPSLPALLKMAEILGAEIGSFFQEAKKEQPAVFPASESQNAPLLDLPGVELAARLLNPAPYATQADLMRIVIPPGQSLPSHFLMHHGDELGYVLEGKLEMGLGGKKLEVSAGDTVYLSKEKPGSWHNPAAEPARLLWIKLKSH